MKLRKLCFVMAAITAISTPVYAASENTINRTPVVHDGDPLENVYLKIVPKDEISTGDSIIITFENAEVFSQEVIDGTESDSTEDGYRLGGYQYRYGWKRGESFQDIIDRGSPELPYRIERLNKSQIEVHLKNIPQRYCDTEMDAYGISGKFYYKIPMVVTAEGSGDIKMSIDSNESAVSSNMSGIGSSVNGSSKTTATTTTKAETTTVKETSTEATTENSREENPSNSSDKRTVRVQIGSDTIMLNNFSYALDAPAYINDAQRAMMPLRAVSVSFSKDVTNIDNSDTVQWISETKTAVINYNNNVTEFTAGSDTYVYNGVTRPMPDGVRAEIVNSRMYVPFRLLGETMGLDVEWEADTKTAIYKEK